MTINQIECFVEVAKAGNISKAAKDLFITQQAVSSQIKTLEKELGFKVFTRKNKGVSLTKEGEILFEEWVQIQEKLRISIDRARDFHTGRSTHIRVALEDMGKCSEDIMSAFLAYEEKYRDLHIDFEIMSPRQMLTQFESDDLDMAVLYESELEDQVSLKSIPLHERKLKVCIYMAKNHPLARKGNVTLADIKNEPIGILKKDCSLDFEKRMNGFFEMSGIKPPGVYQEYASRRDLEIGLMAGRCVTCVYETMFVDEENRLFSNEIASGDFSSRIVIFWKDEKMDTKARSLADVLKEKLKRYS